MDIIETIEQKYADLGYVTGCKHYDTEEPPDRPQVTRNDVRRAIHGCIVFGERDGYDFPIDALLNRDL